jgi:hypothetical protein
MKFGDFFLPKNHEDQTWNRCGSLVSGQFRPFIPQRCSVPFIQTRFRPSSRV